MSFFFVKTTVTFYLNLGQFRNPYCLSPSYPVQSSWSLSSYCSRLRSEFSSMDQAALGLLHSAAAIEESPFYPTQCSARLRVFINGSNSHPSTTQLRKAGQYRPSQMCSTLGLSEQQVDCQRTECLGFGPMHLIRQRHWCFISRLSAWHRNVWMSCECNVCTGAKCFLTFVSLTLCCARRIQYLFYSLMLKQVRKSFLKKHRHAFIFKIYKNSKFLLVRTSTFSRSKCCLFLLLLSLWCKEKILWSGKQIKYFNHYKVATSIHYFWNKYSSFIILWHMAVVTEKIHY